MKTLKQFTKWFTKTGKEDKTPKTSFHSDYSPGKDFMTKIREREAAEKKRREKWSKEFKKQKMSNYTYTNNTPIYNNISSGSISNNGLTDAKIRIDGGENGKMQVDVPLIVNGRDVMKELDEMRDALLLLKRDVDMEAKYPRLKELKDEYERALEKYKTFEAIRESK